MSEYSEAEQWERAKAWLAPNGLWIIAGIAIGARGLWGWRWYKDRIAKRAGRNRLGALRGDARRVHAQRQDPRHDARSSELNREYPWTPYAALGDADRGARRRSRRMNSTRPPRVSSPSWTPPRRRTAHGGAPAPGARAVGAGQVRRRTGHAQGRRARRVRAAHRRHARRRAARQGRSRRRAARIPRGARPAKTRAASTSNCSI